MKRVISIAIAVMMMLSLATAVFAAEGTFTPSVTDKGAPEFVADANSKIGEIIDASGNVIADITLECLAATSVAEAATSTEISEAAKNTLIAVYNGLNDGSMKLPAEKLAADLQSNEVVVRDLFDLSCVCEHAELLNAEGNSLRVTFEVKGLGEKPIYAMTYKNGEWNPIANIVNNGDGTVTCTFDHLCPVAFILTNSNSNTGDMSYGNMIFWSVAMVVSMAALAAVVIIRRKEVR